MIVNNKSVAVIITLFEPNIIDLEYWKLTSEILVKNNIEVFVLNDNPNEDFDFFHKDVSYHQNEFNKGKFETVYSFVKKNNIKSSHIKIIDPDDRIDIESFLNYSPKSDGIILMPNRRKNGYEIIHSTFGTSWTILPTEKIKSDSFYEKVNSKVGNWLEDQVLGIIACINGAQIRRTNASWYIYDSDSGITSKVIDLNTAKEIAKTLGIVSELFEISNSKPKANFPGELRFETRLIENSTISISEKKLLISEINKHKTKVTNSEFEFE